MDLDQLKTFFIWFKFFEGLWNDKIQTTQLYLQLIPRREFSYTAKYQTNFKELFIIENTELTMNLEL